MTNEEFASHLSRAAKIVATWPEWERNILGRLPELKEPQDMPSRIDDLVKKTYPISYPPTRCNTMEIRGGGKNVWEVLQEMHSDIQALQEAWPERIGILEQEKVLLESQLTLETRRVEVLKKDNAHLESELLKQSQRFERERGVLEGQLTCKAGQVEAIEKENARLQSELDNGIKVDVQIDIKGSKLEVSREEMRQSMYRMLKKHSQDILVGRVQDE